MPRDESYLPVKTGSVASSRLHKKMTEQYVQVCPKCGSPDISSDFSQPALVIGGIYPKVCNNCGHTAKIFPEIEMSDLKKPLPKKDVKGRQLESQEYGKG